MTRLKQKLFPLLGRLALVAFGIIFALIVLEIGFRILYPDPSPKLINQGLQFDDTLGLAFTPGAAGWNTSLRGEYSTFVEINSKGLRGPGYDYAKKENTFRILVLGDSFTAGLQVPLEQTFPKRLEAQLQQEFPQPNVEVINAAVIGYGTDNALAYYLHEGYKYQPDLVLLAFFTGNDITDNIWYPLFEFEGDELIQVPPVQREESIVQTWSQEDSVLKKARTFLYANSRLYSVSIELLTLSAVQRSQALVDLLVSLGLVEITRPIVNYGNFYAFRYLPEEAWLKTEALLAKLNDDVEAGGSQLMVAILPDETDVDDQRRQEILESYAHLTKADAVNGPLPSTRLAQFLQEAGIPHVELLLALQSYHQNSNEALYFRYDGHWTPAGHRVAAEAIFNYLINNPPKLTSLPEVDK